MWIPFALTLTIIIVGLLVALLLAWAAWRHRNPLPATSSEAPDDLKEFGPAATNRWLKGLRAALLLLIAVVFGFACVVPFLSIDAWSQQSEQVSDPRLQQAEQLIREAEAARKARDARKAIGLYEKAVALLEAVVGPEHAAVAKSREGHRSPRSGREGTSRATILSVSPPSVWLRHSLYQTTLRHVPPGP